MTTYHIRAGLSFEVPSTEDITQITRAELAHYDALQREKARGIKDLHRDTNLITPAATRVTVTDSIAPSAGYKWVVRMLGVTLASAGVLQAYITSDQNATQATSRRLVASLVSAQWQVTTFPSGACVLNEMEGLLIVAGQNIVSYFLSGWEVPAERISELY
jgi:hypothetical protein